MNKVVNVVGRRPKPEPRDNPSRRREASTQGTASGADDKPRIGRAHQNRALDGAFYKAGP
jgi:hypothetical protein